MFLPYADEIRNTSKIDGLWDDQQKDQRTEPTRPMVINAKKVINALSLNFSPSNFENFALQKFYSHIQALALGEEEPEAVRDTLQTDQQGLENFAPLIIRFREMIWEGDYVDPEERVKNEDKKPKGKPVALGKKEVDQAVVEEVDYQPPVKKSKAKPDTDEAKPEPKRNNKKGTKLDKDSNLDQTDQKAADENGILASKSKGRGKKEMFDGDENSQPQERSQKASQVKTRGNKMDVETAQKTSIAEAANEDDDDEDEEVLKKKTKTYKKRN